MFSLSGTDIILNMRYRSATKALYLDTIPFEVITGIDRTPRVSGQRELVKTAQSTREATQRKKFCEVCGHESNLGFLIEHRIVPEHVTRQLGIVDSRTIGMCMNCHSAVHDWYATKAFSTPYDPVNKRFKLKLPDEIVREYETAHESFLQSQKKR